MRFLYRPPETPSLETWLGRDAPHEREMAGELLNQLGREKALEALLAIHDKEETKRIKQRRVLLLTQSTLIGAGFLIWFSGMPWIHFIDKGLSTLLYYGLLMTNSFVALAAIYFGYGKWFKASQRQQNIITGLLDYESPLIADPLCRALSYYRSNNGPWELVEHLALVLSLLPDDKNALTKDARQLLWGRLVVMETGQPTQLTDEMANNRVRYADFEIAVLRYFARTRDKAALHAIRKLAKAKVFSGDGRRVQEAACAALQSFSEPA